MKGKISKLLVIGLTVILVLTAFTIAVTPSVYSASEDVSNPSDDINQPISGQIFNNSTVNASANGAATFLKVEGYQPWAALVINAGDPSGVDLVKVSFENDTLTITAQDSNETNHVTILVNKEFADKYIADSEGDLEINVSDAVNYEGLDDSNETAEGSAYVFHIEHFSTQTIELSQQDDGPPVDKGEMHTNRAENAAANDAATFLRVEGYQPWAALVINAGNPDGVDAVTVSFENETLTIEAQDSNETNHVTILVNKAFADEYIADSEGGLEINVSDAVNYEGLDDSNESAGGGAMYVFHIEHFSTQTIELTQNPPDFTPPVEGGDGFTNRVENAAANGAVTFLRVEGYQPWATLVINAGNPDGIDEVTVSFEDETLTIEARDTNETNHVTILVNKAFADEYLADSEGDLDIEISDAVNYEGLDNSNESAGGGGMYVFHIEHFSTQTIEISAEDDNVPFLDTPLILIAAAIPVVYYSIKKRKK